MSLFLRIIHSSASGLPDAAFTRALSFGTPSGSV